MFNWYLEILQFRFLKDTNRKLIKNWLSYQEGCDCCVFLGNGATLHVAARDLGIEPQFGTQPNLVQMACRTPRGWQHGADKHLYVSRIAGVMGESRQHLMEQCPASPSCLHQLPRGTGERRKKPEERLKESERGEHQGGKERGTRQDELCKAVGDSYCWRCWLR